MAHHRFKPNTYYNTLGSHPPALNIADGDRVCALTADARGCDESGETVANRGNPISGPFFVEGAEPGDALAVTIHRLFPNRPTGFTRTRIAPNVLDPEYEPDFEDETETLLWEVDTESRKVRPVGLNGTLGNLELPLEPLVELSRCAALNRSAKSIDFRKQSCFRMLMVLLNEIEIEMFCFQKLILGDYSLSTH